MQQPSGEFRIGSLIASVYLPTFLFAVGQGAAIPILPLFALEMGLSVPMAGALVAVRAIGHVAFDVPAGFLVARIGERRAMILGSVLLALAAIGIGLRPPTFLLAILVALMGGAWAIWILARLSYAAEVAPIDKRGRVMSILGGSSRVGNFIGPLLGGLAVAVFGLAAAFYLQALFAIAALISLSLRTPALDHPPAPPEGMASAFLAHFKAHRRLISTVAIVSIAIQLIRAGRDVFLPLWGNHIGLSASQVSVVFGASSAFEMALFYPAGMVMDRFGRKWTGVPCLLILSVGLAVVPLTNDFKSLLLIGLLIGIGNGLGSGIQMTLGSDVSPAGRRAAFLGVWRLTTDGGAAAGPVLMALATALLGLSLAAPAVATLGLAGAGVLAFLVPETLRERSTKEKLAQDGPADEP